LLLLLVTNSSRLPCCRMTCRACKTQQHDAEGFRASHPIMLTRETARAAVQLTLQHEVAVAPHVNGHTQRTEVQGDGNGISTKCTTACQCSQCYCCYCCAWLM
jgi:hypothetical protein